MRRLISLLAFTVGAALIFSACGGDDSPEQPIIIPTETTTGSLGKEEFIEEADAICSEANAAIGEFVANGEGFSAAGEIASLRASVIDDIQSLGPPEEDRATFDSFVAGFEAQVEAGEKIALANERGSDTTEFESELDAAQGETLTAAESYGFTECGQEPSADAASTGATGDTGAVTPSAPAAPAPSAPDTSGGGVGDTGGDTGDSGGGVSPGGGVGPG